MKLKYLFIYAKKQLFASRAYNVPLLIIFSITFMGILFCFSFSERLKQEDIKYTEEMIKNNVFAVNIADNHMTIQNVKGKINENGLVVDVTTDNSQEYILIKPKCVEDIKKIENMLTGNKMKFEKSESSRQTPEYIKNAFSVNKIIITIIIGINILCSILITVKKIGLDKINISILKCCGYKNSDLFVISFAEIFILCIFAFVFSVILYFPSCFLVNLIIKDYVKLDYALSINSLDKLGLIIIIQDVLSAVFSVVVVNSLKIADIVKEE